MKKYSKFIVALAGVAAVFGTVGSDGAISTQDAIALAAAASAAVGVFYAKNKTSE